MHVGEEGRHKGTWDGTERKDGVRKAGEKKRKAEFVKLYKVEESSGASKFLFIG